MLYDRRHLYVVRDPPPLEVDERLRDEVATAQKIQRLLVWGALVAGVLAFCGCSKAEAEPLPDPGFASVVAQECARVCLTGVASMEFTPTSGRCACVGVPNLGHVKVRR